MNLYFLCLCGNFIEISSIEKSARLKTHSGAENEFLQILDFIAVMSSESEVSHILLEKLMSGAFLTILGFE